MTDLIPITALGATTPRRARFGGLSIVENSGLALASLALHAGQTPPAPFGLTLPDVGKCTGNTETGAFWIGRDQWMIQAPGRGESDFAADLRAQAPKASVTDQTDGFVAFEITSANGALGIEALMAKLVNIDPKTLQPGGVTRTGLDHMSVFLIRRAGNTLCVIGMRTFAGALWHAIATAAGHLEEET